MTWYEQPALLGHKVKASRPLPRPTLQMEERKTCS